MNNWRIPAAGTVVALAMLVAVPAFGADSTDFSDNQCSAHAEFNGALAKTSKKAGACLRLGVRAYLQNVYGGTPYWTALKESASGAVSVTQNANSSTQVIASTHYARNGLMGHGLPD